MDRPMVGPTGSLKESLMKWLNPIKDANCSACFFLVKQFNRAVLSTRVQQSKCMCQCYRSVLSTRVLQSQTECYLKPSCGQLGRWCLINVPLNDWADSARIFPISSRNICCFRRLTHGSSKISPHPRQETGIGPLSCKISWTKIYRFFQDTHQWWVSSQTVRPQCKNAVERM